MMSRILFTTTCTNCAGLIDYLLFTCKSSITVFCTISKMGKGLRKIKRHIRRGEGFTRDHIGLHRNHINPAGAGIKIEQGREVHF